MKRIFIFLVLITPLFLNAQDKNTFLGTNAGDNTLDPPGTSSGNTNTFIGYDSGKFNSVGRSNTFLGAYSGQQNVGSYNTFLGYNSGTTVSDGSYNTFLGGFSGTNANNLSYRNTYIGHVSGTEAEGNDNSFLGYASGSNSTGSYNVCIGNSSGANTDGNYNTYVGYDTGVSTSLGDYNAFLGYRAGNVNKGKQNTFIGAQSGYKNTQGNYNTFVGLNAGYANTDGEHNTFIGRVAGRKTIDGGYNTFLGGASGYNNTDGGNNTFLGNAAGYSNIGGDYNTSVGRLAGRFNQTGNYNTYMGYKAGYENKGSANVFIGKDAGGNETNVSSKLIIHNNDSATPLICGYFNTRDVTINGSLDVTMMLRTAKTFVKEDLPAKENTTTINNALDKISQINGIAYSDKALSGKTTTAKQVGFVAKDVEKVLPELVSKDEEGNSYINYDGFVPVLVEAMKDQKKVINNQEQIIEKQEQQITDLEVRMNQLENLISNSKTGSNINTIDKIEQAIVLKQNIPNPASKVTTIEYDIPSNYKSASLNVYDIDGKTLLSQPVAGKSTFKFDLSTLASGTYVYTLTSNGEVIAKQKMIVKK